MAEYRLATSYLTAWLLHGRERRIFIALLIGHIGFVVSILAISYIDDVHELSVVASLATLPYLLPLLLIGPQDRVILRILIYVAAISLAHYLATLTAIESLCFPTHFECVTDSDALCGALGGAVGAGLSFACFWGAGLFRPGRLPLIAIGTIVLAGFGAVLVPLTLNQSDFGVFGRIVGNLEPFTIYTPWQIAFGYFLAKLLRSN